MSKKEKTMSTFYQNDTVVRSQLSCEHTYTSCAQRLVSSPKWPFSHKPHHILYSNPHPNLQNHRLFIQSILTQQTPKSLSAKQKILSFFSQISHSNNGVLLHTHILFHPPRFHHISLQNNPPFQLQEAVFAGIGTQAFEAPIRQPQMAARFFPPNPQSHGASQGRHCSWIWCCRFPNNFAWKTHSFSPRSWTPLHSKG